FESSLASATICDVSETGGYSSRLRGAQRNDNASRQVRRSNRAAPPRRAERTRIRMGVHACLRPMATAANTRAVRARRGTDQPGRVTRDVVFEGHEGRAAGGG